MKAIPFAVLALVALSSACATTSTDSAAPATNFTLQPAPPLEPALPSPAASKRLPGGETGTPLSAETFRLGGDTLALGTVRAADFTLDPAPELEPLPAPALPKKRLLNSTVRRGD